MEFSKYRLGDIADIKISGVDKKTTPGEQSVRLCNFVDVYRNWAITKELYDSFMVATANDNEISDFTIHKGQVAITKDSETRDDIGIATYISDDFEEPVVLGYHTALIAPNEDIILGKYLNALLHTKYFHDYWYNNASGSGMRYTLSELSMRNAVVLLPSIDTQRIASGFLSSIDKKITINRRINERLEGMAKLLYDYWFVQFEFPNEEGKPYKSSGGKMVWNEKLKREIPEGWEVKKLNDFLLASENGDWGDECDLRDSVKVNCVRGADIIDLMSAPERYLSNKKKDKLLREHDIIVEVSGGSPIQATGRCNYVSKEVLEMYDNKLTCSNFCKFLRLSNMEYAAFFYYLWRLFYDNGNMFHYESKTSGIKNLQIDALLSEYWYVPPIHLASIFQKTSTMLFAKMDNDKKESNCLTSLRDFLLPMLMNGQVEIKEK